MINLGYACQLIEDNRIISCSNRCTMKTINKGNYIDILIKKSILNLNNLNYILEYNLKNNINFFRISAELIPFMDIWDYEYYLKDYFDKINIYDFRLDMHAYHFTILNSLNNEVINKSINSLNNLYKIMTLLKIKNPKIILHVGSSKPNKEEAINRFIKNFDLLNDNIKKNIILENDDKIFNTNDILYICNKLNIPMVFDIHHHRINHCNFNFNKFIKTWDNDKLKPKMHISSSKDNKNIRAHNNYINYNEYKDFFKFIKNYDIDIMIEAKMKNLALLKLRQEINN